jgi:signal transduction histidine kinase
LNSSPASEIKQPWRRIAASILAIILPVLSAAANHHFAGLRQLPFALYFLSVILVTWLGGRDLGFLTAFIAIGARAYFFPRILTRPFIAINIFADCILIAGAYFIGLLNKTQRRSATELEAALAALQERTDALNQSLHSGKCASWVYDADAKQLRWFHDSFPIFGRPFEDIEKLGSFHSFVHPDDLPLLNDLDGYGVPSQDSFAIEYRVIWPDGSIHWLEARGTLINPQSNLWRGLTVDITDRKLAEAALLRSEKLAAMGRLASTVAHEINNPLEAVTNLLYLARVDPELTADTRDYLATAEMELARLGDITRLTLGFVRTSETRRSVNIPNLVDEVLTIFRHRYEMKNIHVERRYQPNTFVITTPHELRQIATNLIANAVDACSSLNPRILVEIFCEGDTAILSVADNGVGIAPDKLGHIFEPFFTTKPEVGTGIGLWVTKELIEKNSGDITVESGELEDGMKTRFRIRFKNQTMNLPS